MSRSQGGLRAYIALRRADVLRESRRSSACRPPIPSSSMRYPNGVAAPLWRTAPAGAGVLPPRPAARAGRPDRRPSAPPVLGEPHGQEAPAGWRPAAAGAAPDTPQACPDGHGWPATHNAESAGSRRAGYGGGTAAETRPRPTSSSGGDSRGHSLSSETSPARPRAPAGDDSRSPRDGYSARDTAGPAQGRRWVVWHTPPIPWPGGDSGTAATARDQ